ncbi:hypothetical protein [Ferroacidibacillus organovorans]|uniref:Uncharacterized protein n=1 Tax=Ferroacidibacillus organovorans TaxID=1765683 RepID=A0A1V4EVM8_9BACL|nr:hypothetical protein [Ferroacidibacillus organovorans]OPG16985.1 hypothetical protein B2M26_04020 [Ferroacidibacillus organovorans]
MNASTERPELVIMNLIETILSEIGRAHRTPEEQNEYEDILHIALPLAYFAGQMVAVFQERTPYQGA